MCCWRTAPSKSSVKNGPELPDQYQNKLILCRTPGKGTAHGQPRTPGTCVLDETTLAPQQSYNLTHNPKSRWELTQSSRGCDAKGRRSLLYQPTFCWLPSPDRSFAEHKEDNGSPTLAHNSSHLSRKVLDESPPGPGWKLVLPGQAQTLSLGKGVLILGAFH